MSSDSGAYPFTNELHNLAYLQVTILHHVSLDSDGVLSIHSMSASHSRRTSKQRRSISAHQIDKNGPRKDWKAMLIFCLEK